MNSPFDVIVLGQGLAGTALTWFFRWAGARVLVIDRESPATASKIAAGLITPITGKKLVTTWRYPELWPAAVTFYGRVEAETGGQFFRQPSMVRLFADDDEIVVFKRRRAAGEYNELVQQPTHPLNDSFFSERSGFEMSPGGQLDVLQYLEASRRYFRSDGGYLAANIDVSRDIELSTGSVRLPRIGVTATRLIFCQGIDAIDNPWFRDVQFKPAKGEILTLRISGLTENRVIHRGIWLAPLEGELFKVGSTYEWNPLDSLPTPQGREGIISRLREFLRLPFEVVSHAAAIRPIHRNQYPVLGRHPSHLQLGYFNGLGSKGSLHAPFFARHFVERLMEGGSALPLDSPNGNPLSRSIRRLPITQQAQDLIADVLEKDEFAIDATAGNGHDTQFLAEHVGAGGTVFAFDIQQVALDKTAKRLAEANLQNVVLLNHDHCQLSALIPQAQRGRIAAVMFNLGYLPGGDKGVITQADSTRRGIAQAADLLRRGGLLTILAYTGHDGGMAEAHAVKVVLEGLSNVDFEVSSIESQPGRFSGPRLFIVKRLSSAGER